MQPDLGMLGFDQDVLAELLGGELQDNLCVPDEIPAPPDEAITRPGDLRILGNLRPLCGDNSKPENVDRLLKWRDYRLTPINSPER